VNWGKRTSGAKEFRDLRRKIKKAKMPPDVEKEVLRELDRLEQMHPDAAEASMVRTYIDWLIDMPWSKSTKDNLDLNKAKQVLDEDHYNLEKVKERILEYLSVNKLKKKMKGPILCFIGPPGVGKTLPRKVDRTGPGKKICSNLPGRDSG